MSRRDSLVGQAPCANYLSSITKPVAPLRAMRRCCRSEPRPERTHVAQWGAANAYLTVDILRRVRPQAAILTQQRALVSQLPQPLQSAIRRRAQATRRSRGNPHEPHQRTQPMSLRHRYPRKNHGDRWNSALNGACARMGSSKWIRCCVKNDYLTVVKSIVHVANCRTLGA